MKSDATRERAVVITRGALLAIATLALVACAEAVTGDPSGADDVASGDAADDVAVDIGSADTQADTDAAVPPDTDTPDTPGVDTTPGPDTGEDAVDTAPDTPCDSLGCACTDDDDCASGYCIRSTEGRICSERCESTCPLDGYTCEVFQNAGGDLVQLCVPDAGSYCRPCERDLDCLGLADLCLPLRDGSFCASACRSGELCPQGAECQRRSVSGEFFDVCVPIEEACTPCFDEERPLGEPCGTCDTGAWTCGDDGLTCEGDAGDGVLNLCGGCDAFAEGARPGDPCGTCDSGVWACDDAGGIACIGDQGDDARNACDGCVALPETPGTACGTCDSGTWECVSDDLVACVGNAGVDALNGCGGCSELANEPETACGACGDGVWVCTGTDTVGCGGASLTNECGGCGDTPETIGADCGRCLDGEWACAAVLDGSVVCAGASDPGPWYPDVDNDGYGAASAEPVAACSPPDGWVDNADDCDDSARGVFPRIARYCDGNDVLRCPASGGVPELVETCPLGCTGGTCSLGPCEGRDDGAYPEICTGASDCCNGLCLGNPTLGYGICTQECNNWSDCNPPTFVGEYYCYSGPGVPGLCAVSNWDRPCDAAADCPGEACLRSFTDSTCTWQCETSSDCPNEAICATVGFAGGLDLNVCTTIGETCTVPNDCLSGTCVTDDVTGLGYCTAFCDVDPAGCPTGYACQFVEVGFPNICVRL